MCGLFFTQFEVIFLFSQFRKFALGVCVVSSAFSFASLAPGVFAQSKDKAVEATILKKLRGARPDLEFTKATPSVLPGLYEVEFKGGGLIYSSESGDHFLVGEVYEVKQDRIVNLSEAKKDVLRAAEVKNLKASDMVVYSPKGEVKASMYVFTDVDCGYCRLIHKEVPSLNEMGVEVRYLAFPRAGIGSNSYKKIASAWCAKDKQGALDELKAGKNIDIDVCDPNPISEQYSLGQKLGVTGTPAIVLESGELIPGYLKAPELAKRLKI